jgi:hypothetical protein
MNTSRLTKSSLRVVLGIALFAAALASSGLAQTSSPSSGSSSTRPATNEVRVVTSSVAAVRGNR